MDLRQNFQDKNNVKELNLIRARYAGAVSIQEERVAGAKARLADAQRELDALKQSRDIECKQYQEHSYNWKKCNDRWHWPILKQEGVVQQAERELAEAELPPGAIDEVLKHMRF